MAMPATELLTAAEYLADARERRNVELIGGVLVVDEPLLPHQLVCSELLTELRWWTGGGPERGLAVCPLDVAIGEHDVYAPDVLWYAARRAPGRDDPRPYPVPDLAIEVRSASTWRYDLGPKKSGYERRGLPELWLVDTVAETVLVYRRSAPEAPAFDIALELSRGDELTSPQLVGFALAVDALFG